VWKGFHHRNVEGLELLHAEPAEPVAPPTR